MAFRPAACQYGRMTAAETTRRLTTILASDVVGYSKMMSTDEEATLRTLRTFSTVIRDLAEKHRGRVFKTAGDALLIEFGSAVEAVRCAISIQEDLAVRNSELPEDRQMWFRIGINIGDVMVEGDDLFGDGVNVAARLEGLAEKGGICISGSTFDQVKNKLSIAFNDIGPQSVKNIPDPIQAFRVVPGKVSVAGHGERAPAVRAPQRRLMVASAVLAAVVILAVVAVVLMSGGPAADYPFDGAWRVAIAGITGCLDNSDRSFPLTIAHGKIDEPAQEVPKSGEVSADGAFEIRMLNSNGTLRGTLTGKLDGDAGTGKLNGLKAGCTGDLTLARFK